MLKCLICLSTTSGTSWFSSTLSKLILLVAVTYLLWWLVRRVYQLYAIGRFWLRSWWSTFEVTDEAAGDRQVPNASIVTPSVHSSDP